MFSSHWSARVCLLLAGFLAIPATAHTYNQFDNSANASLHGEYFVREVLLANVQPQGTVGDAISATGTVTFDGSGGYTFNGSVMESNPATAGPQPTTRTITGTYALAANGFLRIDSLVGTYIDNNGATQVDVAYGGLGVAGPNAFVASATEHQNSDQIIGIPVNASATNASFSGTYNAAYMDLLQGDITKTRDATFQLHPNGSGTLASIAVAGYAADQNSTVLAQTATGVSYSLAGLTATGGTINFGSAANLISGTKAFMVSPDGSLILGGSLTGFDMLVGTPAVTNATPGMYKGFYFLGGLEDDASQLAEEGLSTIDSFHGSSSVTGSAGVFINHLRYFQQGFFTIDKTYDDYYTVAASGTFKPTLDTDEYTLGANGQVVIMSGAGTWYSLMVGLQAPTYTGSGVFLNPLGIVNAASFAPATNPVAPLEIVVLFGTGIAVSDWDATTLPLPTQTPDGVQVLINGTAAPLFRTRSSLNPQLIYALVPSSISPANGVHYATFQVVNNASSSKQVTLNTNYTAPGLFAISQGGVGDAAALDGNTLITAASPAKISDTIEMFGTGFGSVYPLIVPEGAGASSVQPFNLVTANTSITVDNWDATLPYVGMAPGYIGEYQINLTVPTIASGDWFMYLESYDPVGLDGGLNVETTLNVSGASAGAGVTSHTTRARPLRVVHSGLPGLAERKPVSGRLPHPGSEVTQ